ncbi:MAG: nucleotidyltransferase domain-containing protein, partial [Sulfurimonas sp.]|nr:nucleotidyltransferase domain-containing protein [Sulfurimonas sp.]
YARDESTKNSDVDIIYEIDKDKKFSMFAYLKLNKYLEESFHAKVDLVRETAIKESLKSYISKDIIYV